MFDKEHVSREKTYASQEMLGRRVYEPLQKGPFDFYLKGSRDATLIRGCPCVRARVCAFAPPVRFIWKR